MADKKGKTPEIAHKDPEVTQDRQVASISVEEKESGDAGRVTYAGEWGRGRVTTQTKKTPPLPHPKESRPRPPQQRASLAKTAPSEKKASTKEGRPEPSEPSASTSRRPSAEVGISPVEIGTRYQSRVTEAKAMVAKVRAQLASSRNTSRIISNQVIEAAERLLQLVVEGDTQRKVEARRGENPGEKEGVEKQVLGMSEIHGMEGRILEKIEQNSRMLRENEKRMAELVKAVEKEREMAVKATYANAVTDGRRPQKEVGMQVRKSLHSLVVTSKNELETGEEVFESVRRVMEAKEGWIKVERVRKAKDRKIIMGCSTKEEREKIKNKIKKDGQHLVVEDMTNKDPLLVLKDVFKIHTDEELVRALQNQNREVFHGLNTEEKRIKIKYRKKARNPHVNHVVVTVSPTIWGRAVEQGRLRVDLQNVFVEDQSPLVQCTRCLGYGHSRKFCGEADDLCSHCGGPHLRADCPKRAEGAVPQCVNCVRAGRESTSHNAFDRDCMIRKKRDGMARASIQYC